MKRLHVHVSIDDLAASARSHSKRFAAEPTVTKPDVGASTTRPPSKVRRSSAKPLS